MEINNCPQQSGDGMCNCDTLTILFVSAYNLSKFTSSATTVFDIFVANTVEYYGMEA